MIIGTSHFISRRAAEAYYKPFGYTPQDITTKLREGEISIGAPEHTASQRVTVDRSEGRYFIEDIKELDD